MASHHIHYDYHDIGTKSWLIDSGMDKADADIASASNNHVDCFWGRKDAVPSWVPFIGGKPDLHFNTNKKGTYGTKEDTRIINAMLYLEESISMKESDRKKSLELFGIALHAMQDVAFHTDDVVYNAGLFRFHGPVRADNIYYRPKYCIILSEFYTRSLACMWCCNKFDTNAPFWDINNIKIILEAPGAKPEKKQVFSS